MALASLPGGFLGPPWCFFREATRVASWGEGPVPEALPGLQAAAGYGSRVGAGGHTPQEGAWEVQASGKGRCVGDLLELGFFLEFPGSMQAVLSKSALC